MFLCDGTLQKLGSQHAILTIFVFVFKPQQKLGQIFGQKNISQPQDPVPLTAAVKVILILLVLKSLFPLSLILSWFCNIVLCAIYSFAITSMHRDD